MSVKFRRVLLGNDHDDAKWLVLSAKVEGAPDACEVRRSINTAALVSGDESLEAHKAALTLVAEEYYARWIAVQASVADL